MEERVGFESSKIRKNFFEVVRFSVNIPSWTKLAFFFGLSKGTFQNYQYGTSLIPKLIFEKMLDLLVKEEQNFFREKIFLKKENWGASKGGKITFEKHPEIFEKGQKVSILVRKIRSFQRPVINISLSENLCEFVGAIIGDGNIDGSLKKINNLPTYTISITGDLKLDYDYLVNYHSNLILDLFNVKSKLYFRKDYNAVIMKLFSKKIFCLLTKRFGFKPGNKNYSVKIPEEILNSDDKLIFSTIRGIFDTDGTFFVDNRPVYKKPYPRIALQTVSRPLFLQLKNFLEKYFYLYTFEDSKRKAYSIEVYGCEQLDLWMRLIGFSNKRHLNKISNYYKLVAGVEPASSAY